MGVYFSKSYYWCDCSWEFLPDLNDPKKEFENKEELVKKGNMTGLWISGLTIGFLMIVGAITGANK